jgi:hypothetical protein
MRKSTIINVFLFFSVMLLVSQVPGVLAQDTCYMSGSDRLPVQLRVSGSAGSSGGSCHPDFPTYFTATLNGNVLQLTPHGGIQTSCSGKGLQYQLTKNDDTISLIGDTGGTGTLTRPKGAAGYNHLTMTATEDYFDSAEADLVGNSIEGSVHLPYTCPPSTLLFNSPILETCTDNTDPRNPQNYIVMTNPIPNTLDPLNPIPGPSFITHCSTEKEPWETITPINKIYIPVDSQWKLTFTCGNVYFGQVGGDNHAVPAFSGYGLLLFCLGIFGLGIWAMRKTRFGNTLAGL